MTAGCLTFFYRKTECFWSLAKNIDKKISIVFCEYKCSMLRRQCWDTNWNIKRLVYCQCRKRSVTFRDPGLLLERCHFFSARHGTLTLIFLLCRFRNWHWTAHGCYTGVVHWFFPRHGTTECLHLRKSWHGTANRGAEIDVFCSARHG